MLSLSRAPERGHAANSMHPVPAATRRFTLRSLRPDPFAWYIAGRSRLAVIAARAPWAGMWRYRSVLPEVDPVTLGEGWTPMLRSKRYRNAVSQRRRGQPYRNVQSARAWALAVTMAKHYGLRKLAVPSAGNAAGALAAYAAAAEIEAHIFMPRDVPFANYVEAVAYGASVTLVDGLISDCARMVAERKERGRLVRHFHAERTIPHRRQEDDGL